jgi:hypothetical protein
MEARYHIEKITDNLQENIKYLNVNCSKTNYSDRQVVFGDSYWEFDDGSYILLDEDNQFHWFTGV